MPYLNARFDAIMFDIYRRAKAEADYNATLFLRILTEKVGIEAAKQRARLQRYGYSVGYTSLCKNG
jgi:hypothetical protein